MQKIFIGIIVILLAIGAGLYFGYRWGSGANAGRVSNLIKQLTTCQGQLDSAVDRADRAEAALARTEDLYRQAIKTTGRIDSINGAIQAGSDAAQKYNTTVTGYLDGSIDLLKKAGERNKMAEN